MTRPMDDDVAEAIEMTIMCQEFNTLPLAGGLFDQDSYDIWRMGLVMTAQAEKNDRDQAAAEAEARARAGRGG
jgi:hypothetical protein